MTDNSVDANNIWHFVLSAHDEQHLAAPLWICIGVLCVGQLLLVTGLLYCGKLARAESTAQGITEGQSSHIASLIVPMFSTCF